MGSASPRPVAVSCSWKLSRDVSLDVDLTALVSSVEIEFDLRRKRAMTQDSKLIGKFHSTEALHRSWWSCLRRT